MENNTSMSHHSDGCQCCGSNSHGYSCDDENEQENAAYKKLQFIVALIFFAAGIIALKFFNRLLFWSVSLPTLLFILAWLVSGADVIRSCFSNIAHGQIFDENFLMTIASVGAFIVGEHFEGATVMILYNIGELLQASAVNKSRKSIEQLLQLNINSVRLLENGEEKKVEPANVPIGSLILIKPGEKVPIDGIIESGSALVETASLTGESVPKSFSAGDKVFSGFIALDGAITVRTEKLFSESAASKVAELIEEAQEHKAKPEQFITRFAGVYTPIVVLAALCLAVIPPIIISVVTHTPITGFGNFSPWVYRSLIFLTVSCPCALVISVPLTYFAGLGGLAKKGILVKGSNFIDSIARLSVCVFDKTGTLTESKLTVSHIAAANGFVEEELIALAAAAEQNSSHPIANAILEYATQRGVSEKAKKYEVKNFSEISGKGVRLEVDGKELLAGNEKIFAEMQKSLVNNCNVEKDGTEKTCVYVMYDGEFVGAIFFTDVIRAEAIPLIEKLKTLGVQKTVILTGDNRNEAERTAALLGIDECYASLLPEEKLGRLKTIIETHRAEKNCGTVSFMGDGINDAPALSIADIGISLSGVSSDLAVESADIVFLNANPALLVEATSRGKRIVRIVRQNIAFAIGVKVLFLLLGAFGLVGMILAIFADVGVCLIAILNSLRARN